MYSFSFPEMLGSTSSKLIKDKAAVRSNLILLLSSERASLFGDPYYGCELLQVLFEQSNNLITDLIIDEIYTSIITFIPQIFLERKDITIYRVDTDIFATINYIYRLDNTSDLYTIQLTSSTI